MIIDILCGVLTNSCLTGEVKTVVNMSGPARTGHILGAINIAGFIPPDIFKQNVDTIIKHIKSLPSKNRDVFLPGEIEFNLSAQRENDGIPLDDKIIKNLNVLADRYNLERL